MKNKNKQNNKSTANKNKNKPPRQTNQRKPGREPANSGGGVPNEGLYFIPLGGCEQFGVNLNVYACDGEYIAVDCGIGFTGGAMPGIDIMLPDPAFLAERKKSLKALIITHAHEDHIGAVAHLWKYLQCPIYTTPFTAGVLSEKFKDNNLKNVPVTVCAPGKVVKMGKFSVNFVPVSHSIPDSCALFIETPHGNVLHSGDWNLDPTPMAGYTTDPATFKSIGDQGVVAYIGDSTNAEVPGVAGTEADIEAGLIKEFKKCRGRIGITIFSSNIGRIISIAKAAKACGRQVGVVGRSLHRMIGVAEKMGYLKGVPQFLSEQEAGLLSGERVVMIVTGSQGEPRSALAKISRGEFRDVKLGKGDTVIFSSRPIPGNESNINAIKNNLIASHVRVVTASTTDSLIHVSGHPCRDEIKTMFEWVRPNVVIPVHGERTQLDAQRQLAKDCGIHDSIVPNNGSVIRLAPGKAEIIDHVPTGVLAVDQKRLISGNHASIYDRKKLQLSGAVHVALALDSKGQVLGEPRLDTVGLLDLNHDPDLKIEDKIYEEIYGLLEECTPEELRDDGFVEEEIRIGLRRYVFHVLGIKPKTTVHVIRV
jgi:ribonuclease J